MSLYSPIVARQRLGEYIPAATGIVGGVVLSAFLSNQKKIR
jgi:hypothetical protein